MFSGNGGSPTKFSRIDEVSPVRDGQDPIGVTAGVYEE